MSFTPEQSKLLSQKLEPDNITKAKPGGNGPKGDYLEGWHVVNEANRIFGFDGWSYRVVHLAQCGEVLVNANGNHAVSFLGRVEVTAGGVTREDVGYGSGFAKMPGDAFESAAKECVTDALKRALRTFGNQFGLALYDKSRENVGWNEDETQTVAPAQKQKSTAKSAAIPADNPFDLPPVETTSYSVADDLLTQADAAFMAGTKQLVDWWNGITKNEKEIVWARMGKDLRDPINDSRGKRAA